MQKNCSFTPLSNCDMLTRVHLGKLVWRSEAVVDGAKYQSTAGQHIDPRMSDIRYIDCGTNHIAMYRYLVYFSLSPSLPQNIRSLSSLWKMHFLNPPFTFFNRYEEGCVAHSATESTWAYSIGRPDDVLWTLC